MLLIADQTNGLLFKNHDLMPVSSKTVSEMNVVLIEISTDLKAVGEDQGIVPKG